MDREQLIQFIEEHYGSEQEYPWMKYPNYAVFRHSNNKKWFALIMDIPKSKLGLPGNECVDVLDIKCEPLLVSTLKHEKGFYPAYHMNKENWITIVLDGSVDNEKIKWLLDMSYDLTEKKAKRKNSADKKA